MEAGKYPFFGGSTTNFAANRGTYITDYKYYELGTGGKYRLRYGDSFVSITPDKIIKIKTSGKALLVFSDQIKPLANKNDRVAFLNLGNRQFKGLVFVYKQIPQTEVTKFDSMVESFSITQ